MPSNIKLELPDLKYKDSFIAAVKEFQKLEHKTLSDGSFDKYPTVMSDDEFQKNVVQPLLDSMDGKKLPAGWVPATQFWIIEIDKNNHKEFAGRINLRHGLTDNLKKVGGHIGYVVVPSKRGRGIMKTALRLAVEKAKELGINQLLLTCDETNEGSKRTIIGLMNEYGGNQDTPIDSTNFESDGNKEVRFWVNTNKNSR
jgi:predicted acetyltransferase